MIHNETLCLSFLLSCRILQAKQGTVLCLSCERGSPEKSRPDIVQELKNGAGLGSFVLVTSLSIAVCILIILVEKKTIKDHKI